MKKLLYSIIVLCMTTGMLSAQDILWNTLPTGGQLIATASAKVIIPPYDSATVKLAWGYNANVQPFAPVAHTFVNSTSETDTVITNDTVSFFVEGYYYLRYRASFTDTAGAMILDSTTALGVTVDTIHVAPTIVAETPTNTAGGGILPYSWDAGNASATIALYVVPGTSTFNWSNSTFWWSTTVTGEGTSNFILSGFPTNNYKVAYIFVITNDVGEDTADANYITSQQIANPQITNNINQIHIGSDSVEVARTIFPNGTDCTYYEKLYNANGDLVATSVGQSLSGFTPSTVSASFYGLEGSSEYSLRGLVTWNGGADSSTLYQFTTLMAPAVLSSVIDTEYTVNATEEYFAFTITSETPGNFQLEITGANDPNFSFPLYVSLLDSFVQGITTHTLTVELQNPNYFVNGATYLVRVFSFNSGNENGYSPVVSFVFNPPAASINFFTASPTSVTYGLGTWLEWSVENAMEVNLSDGIGIVSSIGSQYTGPLYENKTYTLTATGYGGNTVTAEVTVNVQPTGIDDVTANYILVIDNQQIVNCQVPIGSIITITNILGQSILESEVHFSNEQINLNQPSGLYICTVTGIDGRKIAGNKFVH